MARALRSLTRASLLPIGATAATGLLLALTWAPRAEAQITVRGALVNGAAAATGGAVRLTGVVGQAAVGPMAGGGLVIIGGAFAVPPVAGQPVLTSLSPTAGTTAGGTRVRVGGANFLPSATVRFGGSGATAVEFVDDTTLIAFTPARAAGLVSVTVTSGGVSTTLTDAYRYIAPPASSTADTDGDGMPDAWELRFSLNPLDPADAALDDDGDGRTNLAEFQTDSHPHGFVTRYLAEGSSGAFFDTQLAMLNPAGVPSAMLVRYLRTDGTVQTAFQVVPAFTRATVDPRTTLGTGWVDFSTTVESDVQLVVDRTMSWDASAYGAHAETAVDGPASAWYLAEGATHSGFSLYYLLQNPNATPVQAEVEFLLPGGRTVPRLQRTVAANSRETIYVNGIPGLETTDVSAIVRTPASTPIIVERAMYLTRGRLFEAGHDSAGVVAPAPRWFLAEGATHSGFAEFILIANPNDTEADVEVTYLLGDGTTFTITSGSDPRLVLAPKSRQTIEVATHDARLAAADVSAIIQETAGRGIIVERAMWWPGNWATWYEAHNSAGTTSTGTQWGLAGGTVGGPLGIATYVLIANTSGYTGSARVTLLFEDGTTAEKLVSLDPNSRQTVAVTPAGIRADPDFGSRFTAEEVTAGKRFGVVVEALGDPAAQLVVERAMYWSAGGLWWTAGTNVVATRLR